MIISSVRISVAVLFLLLPAVLQAKTYTLLELYRFSSNNSRSLQVGTLRKLQAMERAKSVKAGLFPQAEISVSEQRTSRFAVTKESEVIDYRYRKNERTFSVSQAVYNPQLFRQYRHYQKLTEVQDRRYAMERQKMMMSLLEIYFTLLKETENLKIIGIKLETLHTYEVSAEKKYRNGLGTVTDLLKTRIESDKTKLERTAIEQQIQSLKNQLFRLSGCRINTIAPLKSRSVSDLSLEPLEDWLSSIYRMNPELKVYKAESEAMKTEISSIKAAGYPKVELSYRYSETDVPQSDPSETLALTLTWPIFDGNGSDASMKERLLAREIHSKQTEDLKLELENKLLDAYNETGKTIERIRFNKKLAIMSSEVLAHVKKLQSKGIKTIVDVIEAENENHQILLNLNKSRYDFLINKARLYFYAGRLTFEIMEQFNNLLNEL